MIEVSWLLFVLASLVLIYNADGSQGRSRLMFAVNPTLENTRVQIGAQAERAWALIADHECFYEPGRQPPGYAVTADLFVPALGCSLWVAEG